MRLYRSAAIALVAVTALGTGASAAYTVRSGDTLSGVAARFGVSAADLARANALPDPNRLLAGRSLTVPGRATAAPTGSHVVSAGENLTGIAHRYGVSVRSLAAANRIDAHGILRIGTRLSVPTAEAPAALPARLRRSPDRLALIPHFERWSAANGIPADLVMATTWLESGWQNGVVSNVGAYGIGQLMPTTVRFIRDDLIGVPSLDPRVPEHNIRMSARYLRWLLRRSGGDVRTALAGYYQGPGSVQNVGVRPATVAYVDGVLALRPRFRT